MNSATPPATLTRATLRAAEQLSLETVLPDVLGVDAASVAAMKRAERALDPAGGEWSAALQLLSLYRAVVAVLGGVDKARAWLGAPHPTLGATPAELIRDSDGRARVLRYLDAVQKYELKMPR